MDNPSVKILNQQPSEKHTNDYLLYMLYYSRKIKRISDYKVLHTNNKTLNNWNIDILLTEYSSKELSILLHKIICGKYSNKRHFYTLNCYREALDNLIKKWYIASVQPRKCLRDYVDTLLWQVFGRWCLWWTTFSL